ncbi:MAG: ribonuclease P protein component [Endomicrobium sp.]|jgi:ribonuclease P protein component|nr:ribonuclease P protein component [Endomicrobium sp.]
MQNWKEGIFLCSLYGTKSGRKKFSLTYFERLHNECDFKRVFRKGLKLENRIIKILAYTREDGQELRRLGLVTSKRVGSAVARNKTKRRIREIFRTNKYFLIPGLDLVFILKLEASMVSYKKLEAAILILLKNAKLYVVPE